MYISERARSKQENAPLFGTRFGLPFLGWSVLNRGPTFAFGQSVNSSHSVCRNLLGSFGFLNSEHSAALHNYVVKEFPSSCSSLSHPPFYFVCRPTSLFSCLVCGPPPPAFVSTSVRVHRSVSGPRAPVWSFAVGSTRAASTPSWFARLE